MSSRVPHTGRTNRIVVCGRRASPGSELTSQRVFVKYTPLSLLVSVAGLMPIFSLAISSSTTDDISSWARLMCILTCVLGVNATKQTWQSRNGIWETAPHVHGETDDAREQGAQEQFERSSCALRPQRCRQGWLDLV
jgi:hypothetical protein